MSLLGLAIIVRASAAGPSLVIRERPGRSAPFESDSEIAHHLSH
jgi:hypothetical protein